MLLVFHIAFGIGLVLLLTASLQFSSEYLLDRPSNKLSFILIAIGELMMLMAVFSGEILFNMSGISERFRPGFAFHELIGMLILIEYALFILWYMLRKQQMSNMEKKIFGGMNILGGLLILAYLVHLFF